MTATLSHTRVADLQNYCGSQNGRGFREAHRSHEEHGFVCCFMEYSLLTLEKDSRKGFLLAKLLSVETERERLMFQRATSLSSIPWPFTVMPRFNSLPHIPNRATEVLSRCVSHKKQTHRTQTAAMYLQTRRRRLLLCGTSEQKECVQDSSQLYMRKSQRSQR